MKVVPIPAIVAGVISLALILGAIFRPETFPFQAVLAFIAGALVPAIRPADAVKEEAK